VAADKTPDAEQESASVPTPGGWFVNVGAFSVAQSAVNLSARLTDSGFNAVVREMSTDDGKTLTRVRVIGLDNREDALRVAQDLESNYGTGPVWVGQNPEAQ
jgi:cell division septation protein DedD